MRHQWYGDHRDLVKWGVLLQLARAYDARKIVQVAYLRPNDPPVRIACELGETLLDTAVLRHFRDLRGIEGLSRSAGIGIALFDRPFDPKARRQYTADASAFIAAIRDRPVIVLLDPDTGLRRDPRSRAHVTPEEVSSTWRTLSRRDWLVLYQHASRRKDWFETGRDAFAAAVPGAKVFAFRSPNGARNVALYAASRIGSA